MDDDTQVNRQNVLKEGAGSPSRGKGPNPDFRAMNIAKSTQTITRSNPEFKTMKQVSLGFDIVTGLVGAIPAVGWALNAFVFFPAGFLTLLFMSNSRGKSMGEFFSAYKFIGAEIIPYLNIVTPVFISGTYRLAGESLFGSLLDKLQ
jgi:hypothetical protein